MNKVINHEGKLVVVSMSLTNEESPCIVADFCLYKHRHNDDCFESIVNWGNPFALFTKIISLIKDAALKHSARQIHFSPSCNKRLSVYKKLVKKNMNGFDVHSVSHDYDFIVIKLNTVKFTWL